MPVPTQTFILELTDRSIRFIASLLYECLEDEPNETRANEVLDELIGQVSFISRNPLRHKRDTPKSDYSDDDIIGSFSPIQYMGFSEDDD